MRNEKTKCFEKYKSEFLKRLSKLNKEIDVNEKKLGYDEEKDVEPCYSKKEACFNIVSTKKFMTKLIIYLMNYTFFYFNVKISFRNKITNKV